MSTDETGNPPARIWSCAIEQGALLDAPRWINHKRARNWFAVIQANPSKPGGFERTFQERAKGKFFYFAAGLKIGDTIEFGADYYTNAGHPERSRVYGAIVALTGEQIEIELFKTGSAAIERSKSIRAESSAPPMTLTITLSSTTVDVLDGICAKSGMPRNGAIENAIMAYGQIQEVKP